MRTITKSIVSCASGWLCVTMRTEQELLVDCLSRLNRLSIPYMLTGSMASNFWGIPRTTHDLDFVIALKPTDVEPLATAFDEGFFVQRESIRGALRPPYQFNALDDLSAMKVDFWVLKNEPFERAAFDRRQRVALLGSEAWVATAEDVILSKFTWNKLSPSNRQLTDVAGVYAVQGDALDKTYLQHWAAILSVNDELAAMFRGELKPKST